MSQSGGCQSDLEVYHHLKPEELVNPTGGRFISGVLRNYGP